MTGADEDAATLLAALAKARRPWPTAAGSEPGKGTAFRVCLPVRQPVEKTGEAK